MPISKMKQELDAAAVDAVRAISAAARDAVQCIAAAADQAKTVVAHNAEVADDRLHAAAAAAAAATPGRSSDHDLLIELNTKVSGLITSVAEMKDGTARHVADLEKNKLDIKDSYPSLYKADVDCSIKTLFEKTDRNTANITRLLTWGSVAVAVIGVLEFIVTRAWK